MWADAPKALEFVLELQCTDIKRSALLRFAIFALSFSSTKTSVLLVYTTFTSGYSAFILSPKSFDMFRTMFFSAVDFDFPGAPGSFPP